MNRRTILGLLGSLLPARLLAEDEWNAKEWDGKCVSVSEDEPLKPVAVPCVRDGPRFMPLDPAEIPPLDLPPIDESALCSHEKWRGNEYALMRMVWPYNQILGVEYCVACGLVRLPKVSRSR